MCQAVKKIPKEIHKFKPNQVPDHPGNSFTVEVIKIAKKNIVIVVDNFSGFNSTTFSDTEKSKDLLQALVQTIYPFKTSDPINVRVDQAPGFRKLMRNKSDLSELCIQLEFCEAKNKNALAIVDRKINELEVEFKKITSSPNMVNMNYWTKAIAIVNEKVQHQGLRDTLKKKTS